MRKTSFNFTVLHAYVGLPNYLHTDPPLTPSPVIYSTDVSLTTDTRLLQVSLRANGWEEVLQITLNPHQVFYICWEKFRRTLNLLESSVIQIIHWLRETSTDHIVPKSSTKQLAVEGGGKEGVHKQLTMIESCTKQLTGGGRRRGGSAPQRTRHPHVFYHINS